MPNASSMSHMKMREFVVFESMLDILFREIKCKRCGLRFEEMENAVLGTSIHIVTTCENGHRITEWKAQFVFGRLPAFNLLVSAATSNATGSFFVNDLIAEHFPGGLAFASSFLRN